jgi:hypothetical protein
VLDVLRYDAADKTWYLKAVIDFALKRDDSKPELVEYHNGNLCRKTVAFYDFQFVFKCHSRRLPLDSGRLAASPLRKAHEEGYRAKVNDGLLTVFQSYE